MFYFLHLDLSVCWRTITSLLLIIFWLFSLLKCEQCLQMGRVQLFQTEVNFPRVFFPSIAKWFCLSPLPWDYSLETERVGLRAKIEIDLLYCSYCSYINVRLLDFRMLLDSAVNIPDVWLPVCATNEFDLQIVLTMRKYCFSKVEWLKMWILEVNVSVIFLIDTIAEELLIHHFLLSYRPGSTHRRGRRESSPCCILRKHLWINKTWLH